MDRAVGLADELLKGWANVISQVDLVPASKGHFEIAVNDQLIFSKVELGRHANPGEVVGLVEDLIGPPTFEG